MVLFEPYRALGHITDDVPFFVQNFGLDTIVTVSVGKSWQKYNCSKLNLIMAGPQVEKRIRALVSYRDFTFVASGKTICVFRRSHQVAIWSAHQAKISSLLIFGKHIVSVDLEGTLLVWSFEDVEQTREPIGKIQLGQGFTPSCIMHPDTYLNKVLIGSEEGTLQLWNINTQKKLYEFKGWGSPIRCCVSSPALDVVGIGSSDGKIHIHNIRYDEEIVTFTHMNRGAVTALAFRTDGQPLLAAGGSSGVISIWNLEKKQLQSVIRNAHDSSICSLHFFANEPVLMSSGSDNSIKMWIFDTFDGEGRLLRFRSGHSAPPACIRYYGRGKHILSAGRDRAFRVFSVIQDHQSRELSQHHIAKKAKRLKVKEEEVKLPPVVAFDAVEIRERDWCNVVTCHKDDPCAYTWRLQNFVIGEHILRPSYQNPTPVKACSISACGNFAVLGTEGGWIERFNIQSGISRGSYVDNSIKEDRAHSGPVVGLACDASNSLLISGGYNGDIKVWDFKVRGLKHGWSIELPLLKMVFHTGNGLLATAADDMVIRLYDVIAMRLVRKFSGHIDRITDLCFSGDGKFLFSSSMDSTVRVWDVIGSRQLDAMHVDAAVTALTLSPDMDMLATSHVDYNGIYLWANRMIYSGAMDIGLFGSGEKVVSVSMSAISSEVKLKDHDDESALPAVNNVKQHQGTDDLSREMPLVQIMPELVTLAMLPKAQWQSLINLDIIKIRNKPIEPPKKPEKAPFFLPSLANMSGERVFLPPSINGHQDETQKLTEKTASQVSSRREQGGTSAFVKLLESCAVKEEYSAFTNYLKNLSPSALDLELRILQIVDDDHISESEHANEVKTLESLLDYFIKEVSSNNNFEFIQALIRLFLKIHGETIQRAESLQEKAHKLHKLQSSTWQRLDTMFHSARCMVTFLSNAPI